MRLGIDNLFARRTLQILSFELRKPNGPDSDADGIPDWLALSLGEKENIASHPPTSAVSPFFIEGKSRNAAEVTVDGQPALEGTDSAHWFANIDLSPAGSTSYNVSFPGGSQSGGDIEWSATNILDGGTQLLRAGDSLRLGAWLPDATGQADILVDGGNIDGVETGTVATDSQAAVGTASLRINGSGYNAIRIPDAPSLDGTRKLTLSLWVKPDPASLNSVARGLLSKRGASNSACAYSLYLHDYGKLFLYLDRGTSEIPLRYGTGVKLTSAWQFLSLVFDGDRPQSQRVKIYINGVLVLTGSHPTGFIRDRASDLFLGTLNANFSSGGSPASFSGLIDDVRIDRKALSAAELETLRTTGESMASSPLLAARYNFEDPAALGKDSSATDSFTLAGNATRPHMFYFRRDYTVTATHGSGPVGSLAVQARHAEFPKPLTLVQGNFRYWEVAEHDADPEIHFQPGANLRLGQRENHAPGKFRFGLHPESGGRLGVAARLYEDGPITDIAHFDSVTFSDATQNDLTTVQALFDFPGYMIVRTPVVVTNLPPGATVRITAGRSGVTFLDGSKVKIFDASDFVNGILSLEFLFEIGTEGGYCHHLDIFGADGKLISRR